MSHGTHAVRPNRRPAWFNTSRMAPSAWMLLVAAAALTSVEVRAQARGSTVQEIQEQARQVDQEAVHAAKLAELDAWLRRMTGRYSIEGELRLDYGYTTSDTHCPPIAGRVTEDGCHYYFWREARGVGDCVGVGKGPGVHCVLNVPWPRFVRDTPPAPGQNMEEKWLGGGMLDPAMQMFGIDPDRPGIRYLLVDGQSLATEATGDLQGDTVTFKTGCPHEGAVYDAWGCHKRFWIRIHPDSGNMSIGMEMRNNYWKIESYRFQFTRLPEESQNQISQPSRQK